MNTVTIDTEGRIIGFNTPNSSIELPESFNSFDLSLLRYNAQTQTFEVLEEPHTIQVIYKQQFKEFTANTKEEAVNQAILFLQTM